MTNEELQQIFFVECEESLAAAEAGLAACQAGTHDAETVNAIFRAVHSIKGGAGAFGFAALQAYTHTFETLLSDVREGMVDLTPGLVDLLLRALDVLSDHVAAVREGAGCRRCRRRCGAGRRAGWRWREAGRRRWPWPSMNADRPPRQTMPSWISTLIRCWTTLWGG
jgi:chemotaxis protein histidine kinase CheA